MTASRRDWFRFSLRTMLLVVMLAAVAAWCVARYCTGPIFHVTGILSPKDFNELSGLILNNPELKRTGMRQ